MRISEFEIMMPLKTSKHSDRVKKSVSWRCLRKFFRTIYFVWIDCPYFFLLRYLIASFSIGGVIWNSPLVFPLKAAFILQWSSINNWNYQNLTYENAENLSESFVKRKHFWSSWSTLLDRISKIRTFILSIGTSHLYYK